MKPINHLQELSRIPENKEFECMTLLEKVMFLYKRLTRKQNNLISGKNIMTINGTDILQSGNLEIESGTAGVLYINTTGDDGNLTPEDIEKLNTENGNVVIINDNEYYHKMYENSVYYAFVNVDTITTTHISYKAIYINKDRNTFNKEESTELINYNDLINKPSLNGVVLSGNVYSSELGISYDDLTDKPTIPTKTSDLTNDSGFVTNTYHDNSKQDKLTAGTNITIENNVISASGSGGTSDYNDLSNKPSINNVTLSGNKTLAQIGAVDSSSFNNLSQEVANISNTVDTHDILIPNIDSTASTAFATARQNNEDIIQLKESTIPDIRSDISDLDTNKQDNLVSGTNIKTINNESILGSGNIEVQASITPSQTIDTSTTDVPSNNAVKTFVEALGTIQEIGSNSNGQYIKYSNGILICTKSVSAGASFVSGVYFGSGTTHACIRTGSLGNWAVNFTEIWGAWFSQSQGIGSGNAMWEPTIFTGWSTTSCGQIAGARIASTSNGQSCNFRLLAIGKWK